MRSTDNLIVFLSRRSCMKRVVTLALVLAVLGWAVAAQAEIGTIDHVPAATLLVPYFEVDLNNPNGLSTLFSINNASATAVLAHVIIWSDLSVHVLDFDVYLTGYDVQTINLRDIIVNGNLPQTASAGQDLNDTISPKGVFSQDINFASCSPILPEAPLPLIYLAHLQATLTGKASPLPITGIFGLCAAQALGDNIARGYITVDTVNSCSFAFPGDGNANGTYIGAGGSGIITNQNVLWGDYFIVNSPQNFAQGGPVVHIEASGTDPRTTTVGGYTFYGRYDNFTAIDNREPLATTFATRFLNGGTFNSGTSLLTWRDSKVNQNPFTCPAIPGVRPAWYPLLQQEIVIFDEQEHPSIPPPCQVSPCVPNTQGSPFPAETQRVQVNGAAFPVPFVFGWLFLDLNSGPIGGPPNPGQTPGLTDPAAAQAWVTSTYSSNGHFSVAVEGIQLDNAAVPGTPHLHIP